MNKTANTQAETTPAQTGVSSAPRKTWTPPTVKSTGELKALVQRISIT